MASRELYYYKCPVCNMSQYAENFIKYEFGAKEPLDLGYVQTRISYGRKGIKRISYDSLVKFVGDGGIGDEILARLKHSILAMIHALHKQNLIEDVDLPKAFKSKEYSDLVYKFDNALVLIEKYKKYAERLIYENNNLKNSNLVYKFDNALVLIEKYKKYAERLIYENNNLKNSNSELIMVIDNLQYQNQQLNQIVENSAYSNY